MMTGKIEISRIEHRSLAGSTPQHCAFEVVDHDLPGDPTKGREGVLMGGEEVFHGLADGELDIHPATVTEHHDKKAQPSPGLAHPNRTKRSPVHLSAFAGGKGQSQIGLFPPGPDLFDEPLDHRVAAVITFLTQSLEDLSGGVGMSFEHPDNRVLEGIKLALPDDRLAWMILPVPKPLAHGSFAMADLLGDLRRAESFLIAEIDDTGKGLVGDHRAPPMMCCRISGRAIGSEVCRVGRQAAGSRVRT